MASEYWVVEIDVQYDTYETDDRANEADETPDFIGDAPMAWGADYADTRDLAVVSDMMTGLYVFTFTPDASQGSGQ